MCSRRVSSQLLNDSSRSPAIKDILAKLRDDFPHASAAHPMELQVPEDPMAPTCPPDPCRSLVEDPMAEDTHLSWENIESVTALADKYQLISAIQACEAFILSSAPQDPVVSDRPYVFPDDTPVDEEENSEPFGYLFIKWNHAFPHGPRQDYPPRPPVVRVAGALWERGAAEGWGNAYAMYAGHGYDNRRPAPGPEYPRDESEYPTEFYLEMSFLDVLHRAQMHRALARLVPAYMRRLWEGVRDKKEGVGHRVGLIREAVAGCGSAHVCALICDELMKVFQGMD